MPSKDLMIEIKANTKKAIKEIEELKKEIKEFSESVKKGDVNLKESEKRLANFTKRLTDMAHAYVSFEAVKGAIRVAADFEQSIAKLGAISGASKDNLEALKQKAEELGKTTMFSASEVAEGMNYLAMAGYKTKDILASIGDVLNLAAVGQIDLARASDIASNILSGFGMRASETKKVVDIMTQAITNANTNISELGEAMKYVAPQAKSLGVSIEETTAAIGILSNAGIKATMAGTGLATMLIRLASPTGAAKKDLEELGIKVYDASGKFVGLTNILKQFNEKMKGLSQEAKAKYLQEIFGIETIKTAITLIDSASGEYEKLFNKISNSAGVTESKVKEMTDTFNAKMKELESAFEGLIITIGNDLLPVLTKFVKNLSEGVREAEDFYSKNKELINTIASLAFEIGKIVTAMFLLKKAFNFAKELVGFAKLITQFEALSREVGILTAALSKLGKANAIIFAFTLAVEGLNYAIDVYKENVEVLQKSTSILNDSNKKFSTLLKEVQNHMQDQRGEIQATAEELENLKQKTKDLILLNTKRIDILSRLYEKSQSEEIKREIDTLIDKNRVLMKLYEKLKTTKPYEEIKRSAKEAKRAVEILTQKEIQTLTKSYTQRITQHSQMIEHLKAKEANLVEKISQLHEQLNIKLRSLENQRVLAVESIEAKIHNLQLSEVSEYTKFIDKKKQTDELYYKAKRALEQGNFELAKSYMNRYESLISSIANREIKEGEKVLISKQQANKIAIEGLEKLKKLTNEYYQKEKAQATQTYLQKMQQLRAQLTATRAQLKLEMQRLELEKEMVALLTGKKVNIDTTAATNAIKRLDEEIKALDEKIKNPKKIETDTKEAKSNVEELTKDIESKNPVVNIDADSKDVNEEIEKIDTKISKERKIKLYADSNRAQREIDELNNKILSLNPTIKVKADITQALAALNSIPRTITTIHYVKTVEQHASGGIAGFSRVNGKIPGDDPFNSDDVPALLTRGEFVVKRDAVKFYGEEFLYRLNAKMLPKFATGGLVEVNTPEKRSIEKIGEIKKEYSDNNLDIEGLITQIRELIEKLKGTEEEKILKEELTTLIGKQKELQKANKEVEDMKSSVRGKILSQKEYESFENRLKSKEQQMEFKTKELEKEVQKAQQKIQKAKAYLEEVEKYKSMIKNRLAALNVSTDVLPDNFEYIFDLSRLRSYYEKLKKVSIPSKKEIETIFEGFSAWANKSEPNYLQAGNSLVVNNLRPKRDFNYYVTVAGNFLRELGIKEYWKTHLNDKVASIMQIKEAKLPEELLEILYETIIKQKLPKFKSGGLVMLNGGKLAGYGGGDRNLALLEDGEFVLRKEAVKYYGDDLFKYFNSLKVPKYKEFNTSVKNSEKMVTINLNIGNKSFKMFGEEEVVNALKRHAKMFE